MPRTEGRSLFWKTNPYWTIAKTFSEQIARDHGQSVVQVGENSVPPVFELYVSEMNPLDPHEPHFNVLLMFEVEDGQVELRGVFSNTDEPQDALDELRKDAKLSDWKRSAIMSIAIDVVETQVRLDGGTSADPAVQQRIQSAATAASRAPVTRRRDRVTPQLLDEVARVYRTAENAGQPPTKAVAAHFYKSHSTAARWVGLARKGGHLPPVTTKPQKDQP